ncbi:MAG: 2-oxoacid:acceptor oxidoreductase family protein [Bacillota bacterium]|jgi:2-oxoglutarate ferredoxin oxidoreductase subunit gamma
MTHEVLIAGFGGQGIMAMGTLLAYAGMLEEKNVSWLPSYGPEMRGGTAYCMVVISGEPVTSPLVTEPTAVIVMNNPSLEKFESWVRPGGLLVLNTSLVDLAPERSDIRIIRVPCNEIAEGLGSGKVANMVALGAYIRADSPVKTASVLQSLRMALPERHHRMIPMNEKALVMVAEQAEPSLT